MLNIVVYIFKKKFRYVFLFCDEVMYNWLLENLENE